MSTRLRHLISTTGRLPSAPSGQPYSGVVGAVLGLAGRQVQSGYSVEVWGWSDADPSRASRWQGIDLRSLRAWNWAHFRRWDLRWLAPVLFHSLGVARADILHVHVDPNLLLMPRAATRILHLHTPTPTPFPPAYARLLRRADAVICCSKFLQQQFVEVSGYPIDRTFVVHNGAEPELYRSDDGRAQREEWGFGREDIVLLFAGAIVPEKGLHHLVRAFGQLRSSVPNVSLVVIGSSRLWPTLDGNSAADGYEQEVRRLGADLGVRFLGNLPRDRMPSAYGAADVVVVPSAWDDPHPTVVCEAMAAGRPVVASRAGGITETVVDGQTGILVEPRDENALTAALKLLGSDARLRQDMAASARKHAQLFTWESSARQMDAIYQQLLSGPADAGYRVAGEREPQE